MSILYVLPVFKLEGGLFKKKMRLNVSKPVQVSPLFDPHHYGHHHHPFPLPLPHIPRFHLGLDRSSCATLTMSANETLYHVGTSIFQMNESQN